MSDDNSTPYNHNQELLKAYRPPGCDVAWWNRFDTEENRLKALPHSGDELERHRRFGLAALNNANLHTRNEEDWHERRNHFEGAIRSMEKQRRGLVGDDTSMSPTQSTMPDGSNGDDASSQPLSESNGAGPGMMSDGSFESC